MIIIHLGILMLVQTYSILSIKEGTGIYEENCFVG
jgi:hypothetical protein